MDFNPASEGHTLIIPKKHYKNIFDIPEKILKNIVSVAKTLSEKYKEKLGAAGINILHASGRCPAKRFSLPYSFNTKILTKGWLYGFAGIANRK